MRAIGLFFILIIVIPVIAGILSYIQDWLSIVFMILAISIGVLACCSKRFQISTRFALGGAMALCTIALIQPADITNETIVASPPDALRVTSQETSNPTHQIDVETEAESNAECEALGAEDFHSIVRVQYFDKHGMIIDPYKPEDVHLEGGEGCRYLLTYSRTSAAYAWTGFSAFKYIERVTIARRSSSNWQISNVESLETINIPH